jgi:D-amino-acid dehydrogenase
MPRRLLFANRMRPMFAAALSEHEALMQEADATHLLRKEGWLKLYRTEADFAATAPERELAKEFGLPHTVLDRDGALALEPLLLPVFAHGVIWTKAASVTSPLALTRAYAARFTALGGLVLKGDARSLHRSGGHWRVDADGGHVDAEQVVVALGPWAQDVLDPLGIKLPLAVKRGYHQHFKPIGNAALTRPVLDASAGFILAPQQQGIRLTTGAEFAARDVAPSPVQLAKLMPIARGLFPLGDAVDAKPWMGSRPTFPDSMPVIGRAPGHGNLWLAYGHSHWGLTLGPATGRLLAQMMTGDTPFCDPLPFAAERFK